MKNSTEESFCLHIVCLLLVVPIANINYMDRTIRVGGGGGGGALRPPLEHFFR